MRRVRILAFGAVIVASLLAPAGASAFGDVKGPRCADLANGISSKASYGSGGALGYTVDVQLQLSAASCSNVIYTFYVYAADGTTLLGSQALAGGDGATDTATGLPVIRLHVEFAYDGTPVNTYATTSRAGKILDRGPDIGFVSLALNSSGGSRGYG